MRVRACRVRGAVFLLFLVLAKVPFDGAIAEITPITLYRLESICSNGRLGFRLAALGDVDGDHYGDFAASTRDSRGNPGDVPP